MITPLASKDILNLGAIIFLISVLDFPASSAKCLNLYTLIVSCLAKPSIIAVLFSRPCFGTKKP